jgi:hypothetical protein
MRNRKRGGKILHVEEYYLDSSFRRIGNWAYAGPHPFVQAFMSLICA